MIRFNVLRGVLAALACFILVPMAFGQADTARLQGTVMDAQGAAVNGATVKVTNNGTGFDQVATSNDLGYYTATALPPGHYRVEVSQKGFKKTVRELDLQVAQVAVADFSLTLGDVTESITVEAGQPVIDAADSAIGEVVVGRQITELPLNGRNFTQLATLEANVTRGVPNASATGANGNTETFRNGETGGAALAVNGLRPQANNFILDGIDNNEALVSSIVFFPPADVIDEFRVQTSVAPAQFGRAGGAIVVASLKSGTNSWHGSAFEFNRTTSLQAREFFTPSPTAPYNRNQFGGTIGGPIFKNKLFIFADYQGLRKQIPAGNDVATVPTDKMRQGDFSDLLNLPCAGNPGGVPIPADPANPGKNLCQSGQTNFSILIVNPITGTPFPGNMIPANQQNAAGLKYLNAFPEPNCSPALDPARCHTIEQNFHNSRHLIENWNDFDIRGDYILNTANSFFVRVSHGRADQTNTTRLTTLPSGFGSGTNFNHPDGASIGWTNTISGNLVNEARVGFVRTLYGYVPPGNGTDICVQLEIANCNTPLLGGIALIGGYNGEIEYTGDFGSYLVPQTGYNLNDSVSWTKGKHSFKFGTNIIRRQLNLFRPLAGKGYFQIAGNGNSPCCGPGAGHTDTGYEVSDLLAGFVDSYSHGTSFGMVGTRTWENGFFAQDDWRITSRLTLNLGLRYDVLTWPVEVQDRQANFNLATGAIDLANQNGASRSFVGNDYNNFGPRIGFAYQLTRDGKTVVRGGYGIFYFIERGGISNQLAQNPPFGGENSVSYANGFRITLSGALPCNPCAPAQLISTNATGPLPSGDFTGLDLNNPANVSVVSVLPTNVIPSVSQWNLQIQRDLGNNSSASISYVGDRGKNLVRNYNFNQSLYDFNPFLPGHNAFPNLGSVTVQDTSGNSTYNSLQMQYERRLTHGLQALASFAWSKTLDDSCGDLDTCSPQDPKNFRLEHGRSNIDQNYRFVLSSLYELPIGRGKRWGSNWSRPVDWVLGGWQINGIYSLQAGLPFSVCVDGSPASNNCIVRADLVGPVSVHPGRLSGYFDTSAFALPARTQFVDPNNANNKSNVFDAAGTSGRDILRGPGSSNLDLAIFKNLQLTERFRMELRGQAYNLSNTPHFANPNANLSEGNFGNITSTVPFSFRQVELGVRVTF
jgi:carboxypeptidase family protein/TonB-dependent receptor-like protein